MTGNKRKVRINKLNMVISVVVAFAAWLYVVYSISPTTVKTYRDVPVTYIGEDIIAEDGLGVASASVETITVKLSIKRTALLDFSVDSIQATADVSEMGLGSEDLAITVTVPDDVKIESVSHTKTTVKTAASNNRDVPVTAAFTEASEEANEPLATALSFDKVSVIGAKSLVNRVAYVALTVGEESLGDEGMDVYAKPIAYDADGKAIKHIVILPSVIEGHITTATVKKVNLKLSVVDESSDSYTRTYNVPEYIYIKGPADTVKDITDITATAVITGLTESQSISLNYNLPDGVQIANRSLSTRLKLTVK